MSQWLMPYWCQPWPRRKWNPLCLLFSPQEKMEIANIEPMQSIPLPRKGLRGLRSPPQSKADGGSSMSGLICPVWHAAFWQLCYAQSSLKTISYVLTHSHSLPMSVALSHIYTLWLTLSLSVSHPLWGAILQHTAHTCDAICVGSCIHALSLRL